MSVPSHATIGSVQTGGRHSRGICPVGVGLLLAAFLLVPRTVAAAAELAVTEGATTQPAGDDSVKDVVVHFDRPEAKVMFVLPAESKPVRGIIVHGPNMARRPSPRWTALCRNLHFAHLVVSIDLKRTNRPRRLRENIVASLEYLAKLLHRPELATVPFAATGHSAGGMTLNALAPFESRLLTGANDCSWVYSRKNQQAEAHMLKTPLLFTIGAIPDAFKMIPAIAASYDPARKEGAVWALGFEWGKAHSYANAGTLYASWFKAIAKLRVDPNQPESMRPVKLSDGYLGSREDWDTPYVTIAPYAKYVGDQSKAVWLPNRAFASTWRAYQSKSSPWQLTAETADGEAKLPPFKPGTGRQIEIAAGSSTRLGVTGLPAKQNKPLGQVRYFHDDRVVAQAASAPWTAIWKSVPQGSHAVHAEWTAADGTVGVSNPALIVAEPPRRQRVIDQRKD